MRPSPFSSSGPSSSQTCVAPRLTPRGLLRRRQALGHTHNAVHRIVPHHAAQNRAARPRRRQSVVHRELIDHQSADIIVVRRVVHPRSLHLQNEAAIATQRRQPRALPTFFAPTRTSPSAGKWLRSASGKTPPPPVPSSRAPSRRPPRRRFTGRQQPRGARPFQRESHKPRVTIIPLANRRSTARPTAGWLAAA